MGTVINNLFRIILCKFRSVKYFGLVLLFFFTNGWALKAQPCNIIPNAQKICVGSTITFSRSPLSALDSAYLWSFGDNSTSNQSIPTYQYPQAGNYTVKATNTTTGCENNMTGSVAVTTNTLPNQYDVTGGGNYCAGGTGVMVSVAGSQTGVNYRLYNGPTAVGSVVFKDIPPYVTAAGYDAKPHGINSEGLKRRGFTPENITVIKRAYKTLYRQSLTLEEAKTALTSQALDHQELKVMLDFLSLSTRGIVR
jgi:hypothetical protein